MFSISTDLILETSLVTNPFQNVKDSKQATSKNIKIPYNAELNSSYLYQFCIANVASFNIHCKRK